MQTSRVSASCRDLQASSLRSPARRILRDLFCQFAKPAQRDCGLRVVRFVATAELPDAHSREAAFFDRANDGVLLFLRRDPVLVPDRDEDWIATGTRTG